MAFYNRRLFLQASAAGFLGATGALSRISSRPAFAASTGGYKAMVGIFLKGGVDGLDIILPYDTPSYDAFAGIRPGIVSRHSGETARNLDNLLALSPENEATFGGRRFALAPELAPVHPLFGQGEAAIVGNVGPLLEPTNRTGMEEGRNALPDKLFSHNDQQSTWMALGTEGTRAGWGGRFGDAVLSSAARPEFTTLSAGSVDVFLSGDRARPFRIPEKSGALDIDILSRKYRTSGNHGQDARDKVEAFLLNGAGRPESMFGRDVIEARKRGLRQMRDYVDAFETHAGLTTVFPETKIGKQLANIAKSIDNRTSFGNNRQIFYATQGGFDTHNDQANEIVEPLSAVFAAIAAFREAMIESGQWDDVVVFTMSDFGRTLKDNGDGTDHGWGNHHFVFGGSVAGNRIYGDMPELVAESERFTKRGARLIPSVSVEQYAATLGRWFGLSNGEIDAALPNLNRFDGRDLGFMGGAAV